MRIGLLSDSHGRADTTRQAVRLLLDQGARTLVHLGDIGSIEVIDALAGHPAADADQGPHVPVHLVFGNVDWDAAALGDYALGLGISVARDGVGFMELPDGLLAFLHGHDQEAMNRALDRKPRWLCHGHTHRTLDIRSGSARIINPGALFRASRYTVALLDSERDDLAFHALTPV